MLTEEKLSQLSALYTSSNTVLIYHCLLVNFSKNIQHKKFCFVCLVLRGGPRYINSKIQKQIKSIWCSKNSLREYDHFKKSFS